MARDGHCDMSDQRISARTRRDANERLSLSFLCKCGTSATYGPACGTASALDAVKHSRRGAETAQVGHAQVRCGCASRVSRTAGGVTSDGGPGGCHVASRTSQSTPSSVRRGPRLVTWGRVRGARGPTGQGAFATAATGGGPPSTAARGRLRSAPHGASFECANGAGCQGHGPGTAGGCALCVCGGGERLLKCVHACVGAFHSLAHEQAAAAPAPGPARAGQQQRARRGAPAKSAAAHWAWRLEGGE